MKKPARQQATNGTEARTGERVAVGMDFAALVPAIREGHTQCAAHVCRTVNVTMTQRYWVIGTYIREYELNGADRAAYGVNLLATLAQKLRGGLDRCHTRRHLGLCRQLFDIYPEIWKSVISEFVLKALSDNRKSVISESHARQPNLVFRLSFTHLIELMPLADPIKRAFYEIECIRGNRSVRQLKRQIATLYFDRSGLSEGKEKLSTMVLAGAEMAEPKLAIQDPYIFEFLGLRARDAVTESYLKEALAENLRNFLLELGNGFCLEARQKGIVIGKTRGFVDLVFYHRLRKCHVLVELKVDEFRHEHLGQLNTYVAWYRKHMMGAGDSPPLSLLLCTGKNHALVEYALAAVDNRFFVSKCQLELPSKDDLLNFVRTNTAKWAA